MTTVKIYGIKNCDTMKKAFKWLDEHGVDYTFHDYKKLGVPADVIKTAIHEHGWEIVINRRGTTWRKLPEHIKATMNAEIAVNTALENPSIVKRPLLIKENEMIIGFDASKYGRIL